MSHMRPLEIVPMRPQGKSRVRSHEWRHVAEYSHFLSMLGWPVTPSLLFADGMALSFYAGSQIHDRPGGTYVTQSRLHRAQGRASPAFARELASARPGTSCERRCFHFLPVQAIRPYSAPAGAGNSGLPARAAHLPHPRQGRKSQAQDSLIQVKDEGKGHAYCRMKGGGTSVVSSGHSAPILEAAKHTLNFMALLIESFIIFCRVLSIFFGRNAGSYASIEQRLTKPVRIMASTWQQFLGFWHGSQQLFCPFILACLPLCEGKGKCPPLSVAKRMELGIQSASCASDATGKSPFLSRLAVR